MIRLPNFENWMTSIIVHPYITDQKLYEEHFIAVSRNNEGRYVIKLPFKKDLLQDLGDSRSIAFKRF